MKSLKSRIISSVTAFSMLLSFGASALPSFAAASAQTNWYIKEDFSVYTTNAVADNVTLTSGNGMVLETEDKTNKYFEASASKGIISFSQSFISSASVEDLKFTIDIGFEGGLENADIKLTGESGSFTVAKIGKDKSILSYDGKKLGTLSTDRLTTLLFTFNKPHSRYSVYANGKKIVNDYYINVACPETFTGYSVEASVGSELKFYADSIYAYSSDKIISKENFPKSYYSDDAVELLDYEDVYYDDRIIILRETFEDDPRKYHELVKNYSMYHYPYENIIEVKEEDDGNKYLSMEGFPSAKNFFSTINLGEKQRVVAEFSVCTPTLSTISLTLYDSLSNHISLLSSDTSLKLSSNKKTVGYIDSKKWVRVALSLDNEKKTVNVYVDGEHTGVDIPMADDKLVDLKTIRFYAGRNHEKNVVMVDNVITYTGTELYDYSKILANEIDENSTVYNHNTRGVEEFLKSYNALHTVTGKLYAGGMDKVTAMPYYENDVLYVALADAEKLVFGKTSSDSKEFVALEDFAKQNGKAVTLTKTNTLLVGEKEAVISDMMVKYVNAYMTYDRPTSELLKDAFNNVHPRITINPERLERLKAEFGKNEYITKWGNNFIKDSEKYLTVEPQEFVEMNGNDGRMLVPAKTIRERVQKLALSYHFTGERKYVDRAWTELENACNFPYWHQGKNELDSSMMAAALAYGYDWLYYEWTPEQRKTIEDALCRHQLDQAQEVYHGIRSYGWAAQDNNWNPHCNGDTALGSIAIFETDPQKHADIISNAVNCLDYAVLNFYPDGAWMEGPSYWNGTTEPMTELCSSLNNTFGSSYNIEHTACFDITVDYVIGTTGPTGVNNFNDAGETLDSARPNFHWFANEFNRPEYSLIRLKEINSGNSVAEVLDMCYLDTDIDFKNTDMPLDSYFEGLALVAFKSAQSDPNATYVSFHSGNNRDADAHSHIDAGTFVLDMMGERFARDPGSHYYFTEGHGSAPNIQPNNETISRWNYYQHIPEGHNTIIINPDDKTMGQNIITDDKMETVVSKERGAYAITSLNSAYKGFARSVKRGIMLGDDRRSVTVRDEIKLLEGENDIYWFMQTDIANNITYVDDKTVIMELNGKKVKMMLLTDAASVEMYEGDCTQLFLTPAPEQIPIKNLKRFTIKLKATDSVYIQVKFIPLDDPYANIPQENIPLESWSIPDGEIQELPYIDALYVDGVKNASFKAEAASNDIPVDIKTKHAPELSWDISDKFDAEITKHAEDVDGVTVIRVWRKDNPELYRLYNITFNPYSIEALEPYRVTPVSAEASDVPQQENSPERIYDKDINTYWGASGEGHWIIADLGETKLVDLIGVAFKSGDARMTKYQLFISEDKENWKKVYDGMSSGVTTNIELSEKIGENARYIKLVGFGNTVNAWNSITEICAYSLEF